MATSILADVGVNKQNMLTYDFSPFEFPQNTVSKFYMVV